MIDIQKKVEVVRENWYKTDCKGLSASVIKDAYERGFNRAYQLLKAQKPAEISEREDQNIWQAVQRVGVDVDKDELIRALKYDRGQYEKGYADAMKNAVPLDKLCKLLADMYHCPSSGYPSSGHACHPDCTDEMLATLCGTDCDHYSDAERWKAFLIHWMEEQDAD